MQDEEGVSRTVTVGQGLEEVRNRLTEGAEQLDFPAIMDGPPEAQQPMAVAADETNGLQNRIVVVPPHLQEGNPSSMPVMRDLRHIQMPAPNVNQPIEENDLGQPSENNMPEEHGANQNKKKRKNGQLYKKKKYFQKEITGHFHFKQKEDLTNLEKNFARF